ncbi:hypothetical protein [Lysinibacillus sp. NPDC056185]|uniref:hypothetical protein n=1 Tax=Lysinibacillus sp. NPDC056185 TaxID=3345739 RepID=UPI0039EEED61
MTKEFYTIPKDWFTNLVIEKFRAYVIVDVENKIQKLILSSSRGENYEELIAELNKKRNYYSKASNQQLLDEFVL